MVALRHLLPQDPDDRSTVEGVLREHPDIMRFIERFSERVRSSFGDVSVVIDSQQFDPWDPPITVIVRGPMSEEEYLKRYALMRDWAKADPEYDASRVHISLRTQSHQVIDR